MIKKSEFIWNTIASITTAGLSSILLLVVTRTNGSDTAGMFAITFATATILYAIGEFGIRIFQVTDTKKQFSFEEYLTARMILSAIMMVSAFLFCLFSKYDEQKLLVCILLVGFRLVEIISDTYQGEFQSHSRLDIASQSLFIRTAGAIVVFTIIDIVTQNLLISVAAMILWGVVVLVLFDFKIMKRFLVTKSSVRFSHVKDLIILCIPAFFSSILNLYIVNAPKYAIDEVLQYSDQTVFNIIYLPTFTINLMSLFALKPILLSLGVMWNEQNLVQFKRILFKLFVLIMLLTGFIELVCYFVGIPILMLIYGVDLVPYKIDLLILIISGGLSALSVMFSYALTTMRYQKIGSIPYFFSAITALLACSPMVSAMEIRGAAWASVLIMLILALSSGVILFIKFRKKEKELSSNH